MSETFEAGLSAYQAGDVGEAVRLWEAVVAAGRTAKRRQEEHGLPCG